METEMTLEAALKIADETDQAGTALPRGMALVTIAKAYRAATTPHQVDEAALRAEFEANTRSVYITQFDRDRWSGAYLQDFVKGRWQGWLAAKRHAASVGVQRPDALELAHLRATEVAYETLKAQLAAAKPSTASAAAQGEYQPKTELGKRLWAHRQRIATQGGLQAVDEILAQIDGIEAQQPASAAQGEPVAWRVVNRRLQRSTPWQDVAIAPIPKGRNWAEGWEIEPAYGAPPPAASREAPDVDWLANVIRTVDGSHTLGAGALAEKIRDAMLAAAPKPQEVPRG